MAMRKMDVPLLGGLRVAQPQRFRCFVERRLARRFTGFVCVSRAVAHQASYLGYRPPAEKLHVIVNGIDATKVMRATPIDWAASGIPTQRRVILFVGRLAPQKGVDLLIEAARKFLPQLPQHDLVVVGDGPERSRLVRTMHRAGLQQRVRFVGWRSDATSCIAAAEVVVVPSRYEGMSNVLLESMAAGKPVVATVVEGVVEALGDSRPWQTCPPNNAAELARAIAHLAHDARLREQLGHENQSRVVEHFSLQKMIAAYAQLFQQTAASHQPSRLPRN
jgi:glycosyltransferase involved in cell wall biosynthesis